jgi:type IV secretion system protein VirB3
MLAAKPFPRVLSRHNLVLGGEREPVLISAITCGMLAIPTMNLIGITSGAVAWVVALQVWRAMAKADPQMTRVWFRSLRYRGYYPAFSRPYRDKDAWSAGHYMAAAALLCAVTYTYLRFFA